MRDHSALFVTDHVRAWLAVTDYPCILHVFDRACNLINEDRQVLSVVTTQIGNGPFNLVIEEDLHFIDHIHIDTAIHLERDRFILGDFTINTANAQLWDPVPDWATLRNNRAAIANQLVRLPMTNYQPQIATHSVSAFVSALAAAAVPTAKEISSHIAGLGNGLTPAGDDFLMGAMYAAWIIHPNEIADPLARAIAETAAPLTTSLSAAWLKSAARGEAGIQWHQLFDVLNSNDPLRIEEAMNEILVLGETSGADALSGFIGAFIAWKDHEGSTYE